MIFLPEPGAHCDPTRLAASPRDPPGSAPPGPGLHGCPVPGGGFTWLLWFQTQVLILFWQSRALMSWVFKSVWTGPEPSFCGSLFCPHCFGAGFGCWKSLAAREIIRCLQKMIQTIGKCFSICSSFPCGNDVVRSRGGRTSCLF